MKVFSVTILILYFSTVWSKCPYADLILKHPNGETTDVGKTICPHEFTLPNERKNVSSFALPKHLTSEPDENAVTREGCKCSSSCGATGDDGFLCDWCKTEDKCGKYSYVYGAYYDYCTYPVIESYEKQSWKDKMSYIVSQVNQDNSYGPYPNVAIIFAESAQTSFDVHWDFLPNGRQKSIHGLGVVCEMKLKITGGNYTGVLEKGEASGLIRMGSALDLKLGSMVPGNGYKIFRSGKPSANWVSLYSLAGIEDGNFNFFDRSQKTHVPPPTGIAIPLGYKFQQASNCILQVGLSDAARYTQDGQEVSSEDLSFPYQLEFAPTEATKYLISSFKMSADMFLGEMVANIPHDNFGLFDIVATSSPAADAVVETIGQVVVTNQCTTSKFGDEKLFFKHQRIEDDFKERPWWLEHMDLGEVCWKDNVGVTPPPICVNGECDLTPPKKIVRDEKLKA